MAISAAGVFDLPGTGAAGALILRLQLRRLRDSLIPVSAARATSLAALRRVLADCSWRITGPTASSLQARTPGTVFDEGERVCVEFSERQVLVASMCALQVGCSGSGQQRCVQRCERIRRAGLTYP